MNIQTITLQQAASQQLDVSLNEQACTLNIRQLSGDIYVDLYVNSKPVVLSALARDRVGLTRHAYLPFKGELLFVDTHGSEDPQYKISGDRWQLLYLYE